MALFINKDIVEAVRDARLTKGESEELKTGLRLALGLPLGLVRGILVGLSWGLEGLRWGFPWGECGWPWALVKAAGGGDAKEKNAAASGGQAP